MPRLGSTLVGLLSLYSPRNLFLGFVGLKLFVLFNISARLTLAVASGGLAADGSPLIGEFISAPDYLKFIDGIFPPNPYDAFVVYGTFLPPAVWILVLITGFIFDSLLVYLSVIMLLNGSYLAGSFLAGDSSSIPPSPKEPVLTCSKLLLFIYSGLD